MQAQRKAVVAVVIGALMLVLGPVVGLLATVLGVHRAFGSAVSVPPAEKAKSVADGISNSMNWVLVGMGAGALGVVVLAAGIFFLLRARAQK